jgi:myosin-5
MQVLKHCRRFGAFGVKGKSYLTLFRAIVACLQLGNLTFASKPDDEDRAIVTSRKKISDFAELVGCDEKTMELAFTERTLTTRVETYKVPLRAETAKKSVDIFAKEIYSKAFLWLVRAMNNATCAENNCPGGPSLQYGSIGLSNILGFESFSVNDFEQICSNYCNEKLQQKFTKDIFQSVLEEYTSEGLDVADIKYQDNSDVLDFSEGRCGFFDMLNEATR